MSIWLIECQATDAAFKRDLSSALLGATAAGIGFYFFRGVDTYFEYFLFGSAFMVGTVFFIAGLYSFSMNFLRYIRLDAAEFELRLPGPGRNSRLRYRRGSLDEIENIQLLPSLDAEEFKIGEELSPLQRGILKYFSGQLASVFPLLRLRNGQEFSLGRLQNQHTLIAFFQQRFPDKVRTVSADDIGQPD